MAGRTIGVGGAGSREIALRILLEALKETKVAQSGKINNDAKLLFLPQQLSWFFVGCSQRN